MGEVTPTTSAPIGTFLLSSSSLFGPTRAAQAALRGADLLAEECGSLFMEELSCGVPLIAFGAWRYCQLHSQLSRGCSGGQQRSCVLVQTRSEFVGISVFIENSLTFPCVRGPG